MVSTNEMKSVKRKRVRFYFADGEVLDSFVESYQFEEDEDEEPMLLCSGNLAVFQSELERIEIIN